jgi:hypothetical protein
METQPYSLLWSKNSSEELHVHYPVQWRIAAIHRQVANMMDSRTTTVSQHGLNTSRENTNAIKMSFLIPVTFIFEKKLRSGIHQHLACFYRSN